MFIYILLATIVVSYLLLRWSFKSMNKDAKETAPIGCIIFIMFIPFLNLVFSIFVFAIFGVFIDKMKFINKFFLLKE